MIFDIKTKNSENLNRLKTLNKMTLNVKADHLFTKVHFINTFEYRIFGMYQNGDEKELINLFNENLTAGPASSSLFSSRWLQAEMYRINPLAIDREIYSSGLEYIENEHPMPVHFKRYLKYLREKYDNNDGNSLKYITFKTCPITMPETYELNYSQKNVIWKNLFIFNCEDNSYKFFY